MPTAALAKNSYAMVLAVSPDMDDAKHMEAAIPSASIRQARNYKEASALLRSNSYNVIVCDSDLADGRWTDLLSAANNLPDPPRFIVMSRLADEDMWVEVLSRGAFDLISKPLAAADLQRALPTTHAAAMHASLATA